MIKYSTALSHFFLAGTGFFCFKASHVEQWPFSRVSFGILAINSILGVWRYGNPTYGYKINKLYRFTAKLQDLHILPCIVTSIWLKYNYCLSIACAHTFVSLIPLLMYLLDKYKRKSEPTDVFLGGNLISLVIVSYLHDNFYGVNSALAYIFSYFFVKRDVISYYFNEMPMLDLYNYSLCFFVFFALKAVLEPIN